MLTGFPRSLDKTCMAAMLAWFVLPGCQTAPRPVDAATTPDTAGPTGAYDKLGTVLWVQHAAEYRASALQAFAWAQDMLDKALADRTWTAALEQRQGQQTGQKGDYAGLPPAVIVDVDETVLDNSPYQARLVREQGSFTVESWHGWAHEQQAAPVPGALEFARYAASKQVRVFYITNRDVAVEADTRENLAQQGFPLDPEVDTLLMANEKPAWTSDKTSRRAEVARTHRILLLVGDNLGDFAPDDRVPEDQRNASVSAQYRDYWGTRWIVIPNPMYGTWESAALDYQKPPSTEARVRTQLDALDERRADP